MKMIRVYSSRVGYEACFILHVAPEFTLENLQTLTILHLSHIGRYPASNNPKKVPDGKRVIEIRPIPDYPSPSSSKALKQFANIGITSVIRCELAKRYFVDTEVSIASFLETLPSFDSMQERAYEGEDILKEDGGTSRVNYPKGLEIMNITKKQAIEGFVAFGMREPVAQYWYEYFFVKEKRNPRMLEILTFIFGYTEHSKHPHFINQHRIDGKVSSPLMDIVRASFKANPGKSIIAFKDNASVVQGFDIMHLLTSEPEGPSSFKYVQELMHVVAKAETHNHPSGISPKPGAETGIGGMYRDIYAMLAGIVASSNILAVGALRFPFEKYKISGQNTNLLYPGTLARPEQVLLGGSNGVCDYGNQHGTPCISGGLSSTQLILSEGRYENLKPIVFVGGMGIMPDAHRIKTKPAHGMLIIGLGGPVYPIGFGGGLASSNAHGTQDAQKDKNSVQRGDALTARNVHDAITDFMNLSIASKDMIIKASNDQGAAGICNALIELISPVGGEVDLCKVHLGADMSSEQIWLSEAQERYIILIEAGDLPAFSVVCRRRGVNPEILGRVVDSGRIKVIDSHKDEVLMDIELAAFDHAEQKVIEAKRSDPVRKKFIVPEELLLEDAMRMVFEQLAVGSKRWIVNKADQTVGGRTVMHQFGGPRAMTVNDCAVVKLSTKPDDYTGVAFALGFKPNTIVADPEGGAIQSVVEALCNLVAGAPRSLQLSDVAFLLNEMWSCGTPEENERMYRAVKTISDFLIACGLHINGGTDSLSMRAKLETGEIVKSLDTLTATAYAAVSDVHHSMTPYVKHAGESMIGFVDFSVDGNFSLTGSALAQAHGEVGDLYPKVDPEHLMKGLEFTMELKRRGLISACHDTMGDGILIALCEMLMAGCSGGEAIFPFFLNREDLLTYLFAEAPGMLVECNRKDLLQIKELAKEYGIMFQTICNTTKEQVLVFKSDIVSEKFEMTDILKMYERTSFEINKMQVGEKLAQEEFDFVTSLQLPIKACIPPWGLSHTKGKNIDVAIITEEGSNGTQEMAAYFIEMGFNPINIPMSDLRDGKISLKRFCVAAFVGGFTYGDVFGSAVGWAASIIENPRLSAEFEDFFSREDTMAIGVCNGCQLFLLLDQHFNFMFPSIPQYKRPKLTHNKSGKFESRESLVRIFSNDSKWLAGMEGSIFSIATAHGEGMFSFKEDDHAFAFVQKGLAPIAYVDEDLCVTTAYPQNPNGSPLGIAAVVSENGRFLASMPHPERMLSMLNASYKDLYDSDVVTSPWLMLPQNSHRFVSINEKLGAK